MPSIAILTPTTGYYEDWSVPKSHYEKLLGPDLAFRSWTEPGDLSGFDLILPLLAWGYQRDCPSWFALLDRLEAERLPIVNPATVLRWNTDKSYLLDLVRQSVAIVPTRLTEALRLADLADARAEFGVERLVVKPPISGGADGTFLLGPNDDIPDGAAGRQMLTQPFLPSISEEGEYSLFYFGGQYSHAILKRPAGGDFRVQEQFGGRESTIEASSDAKALAEQALAAADVLTGCSNLAYARIDMIRGTDGKLCLMELELIEPSLFLHRSADEGAAFAKAIFAAA